MSHFDTIESAWIEAVTAAIIAHNASLPDERFYAGSLWLFYTDYTLFGMPAFALNTESHIKEHGQDLRWAPADWQFPCIESAIQDMRPHYLALNEHLSGKDKNHWDQAVQTHYTCIARVCRRITHDIRSRMGQFSNTSLSEDFVVGIFDLQEDEPLFSQLVRTSIAPEILASMPHPIWETS
jgi:hypothetical protein